MISAIKSQMQVVGPRCCAAIVPEEQWKIAQRFNPGICAVVVSSPTGTTEFVSPPSSRGKLKQVIARYCRLLQGILPEKTFLCGGLRYGAGILLAGWRGFQPRLTSQAAVKASQAILGKKIIFMKCEMKAGLKSAYPRSRRRAGDCLALPFPQFVSIRNSRKSIRVYLCPSVVQIRHLRFKSVQRIAPIQNSTFRAKKPNVFAMRMNMKPAQTAAIFGAAIMLCLSGCGKKTDTGAASPETSTENSTNYPLPDPPVVVNCTPGIRGGRFIIPEPGEPKTFNCITANESSSNDILRFMFWNLLNFDEPSQTVEPGLAESWTNSPDGKTWTFRLRKNLRWSDGEPLTADDVVFTWNDVIYNPKIDNVTRDAFIIDGKKFTITKVDDLTIQVETPVVYAPFLATFGAGVPIIPKHILEKSVQDGTFTSTYTANSDPRQVVGSGPYRLKEYKSGQYTILERNPYFLEVDKNGTRLPYFDDIIFTTVPDLEALALSFLSGESDVDDLIYPSDYDRFKAEADKGKITLLEPGVGLEMTFFWFNQNTGTNEKTGQPYVDPKKLAWFRNTKFRQAVSYAINRDAIIQSVYSSRGVPAYGPETSGDPEWQNTNVTTYPYNPDKALELLKEIGIEKRNGDDFLTDSNGNKIEFVFNTNVENDHRKKTAVLIQNDLNKLGMHVVFQPVEFNSLAGKIQDTYDYDCILMGLAPGSVADPSGSMNVFKSSGYTHFWFPRQKTPSTDWEARIDDLMDAQIKTLDMSERKKDYDEVQEIMAEQQPFIFTTTPIYYAAIVPNVANVRPTPLGGYRATWNIEELYFKK